MPSAPPAIPGPLLESVRQVLAQHGDTTALRSVQRAPGGFIISVWRHKDSPACEMV